MEAAKTTVARPPRGDPLDAIPHRLRLFPRWMGTRFTPRPGQPGKMDKPPYRIREGLPAVKADKMNPDNWASYKEARAAFKRGDVDAIGFVVTDSDPFFVGDLDSVIAPETGEIKPEAHEVIHALDSYAEISCSGCGVHVIGVGRKPAGARCRSRALGIDLEIYDASRFVVLTGERIGPYTTVEDRQEDLEHLCRRLWPQKRSDPPLVGNAPGRRSQATVEDRELLQRARQARTGVKFRALYDQGDTGGYGSQSEADFALINALIFWMAGDEERVIRLFKDSALYREEKHTGYVETSVSNALASYTGSFYKPRAVKRARREAQEKSDPLDPYFPLLLDPARPEWRGRRGASLYKGFAGALILAADHGIVDGDGNLRIDCDVRTFAEAAGMSLSTASTSALPGLVQEKLLLWRRGKGQKQGQFILPKPTEDVATHNTKVSTHFSVMSQHNPDSALDTLRLLIRMRTGRSKRSPLARLGMVAMFVLVAMCSSPSALRRGQTVGVLAQRTGRRKPDLRRVLTQLQTAHLVCKVSVDCYRLAPDFRAHYERELEMSGITFSERAQRKRHETDRRERERELRRRGAAENSHKPPLKGSGEMRRILAGREREERDRRVEEERRKAGVTATTRLADEMQGVTAMRWESMRARWLERGGCTDALRRAVMDGPYQFRREGGLRGELYVYHEGKI